MSINLFSLSRSARNISKSVCISCRVALDRGSERVTKPYTPLLTQVRHATHGASGVANGPKNRPGRRLGLKRGEGEYVTPNTIIFRQRGTKWHAGENCHLGRDHTVVSSEPGYVRYYRDPLRHPNRKYIGIVFDRADRLPYPPNAPRRRRLGLIAVPMRNSIPEGSSSDQTEHTPRAQVSGTKAVLAASSPTPVSDSRWPWATYVNDIPKPTSRNLSYRVSNEEIGRIADQAGVTVRKYDRNDRWAAWRKNRAKKLKESLNKVGRKGKQKAARKETA